MNKLSRIKLILDCRKELWLKKKLEIDLVAFQRKWRLLNSHNTTEAGRKFDIEKVEVGDATYGTLNVHCWDNPAEHLKIGSFCSIAENVHFILGGMHPTDKITTFPYSSHVLKKQQKEATGTNGPIILEDDVWLCYGTTVLSGVTIGKGSIIAANSTVTKDVPPYSIMINGELRERFSASLISKLLALDLHKIEELKDDEKKALILNTAISEESIDGIISYLS